ncbi:MAG: PH domain-containing protein [Mycobacteriaceae bacterium]|nr:PH domain-containing protein [Mycobacteriaceae bacterium]
MLGSATGNSIWPAAALGLTVAIGLLRWVFTTYQIDEENVALRTGVLRRRSISVPRNRIRSVQTDSRVLHRLLGLTVLRVGTGHESRGHAAFALDAVEVAQVPRLRAALLADSASGAAAISSAAPAGRELARWHPSWLRYAPMSFSGLVMIAAAVGLAYQSGVGVTLQHRVTQAGAEAAHRTGVVLVFGIGVVGIVVLAVLLAVLWSWLTYGGLVLRRDAGVLHLRQGVLRVREHTFDMRRLRGATLREPLPVRALRGARLDAVMTGVHGEGESSVLVPPCPADTAKAVLADLIDNPETVNGRLRDHGPAAARRRWTRALTVPALLAVALAVGGAVAAVPVWLWIGWAAVAAACVALAVDRVRSLGHRVDDGWLVARAGSLQRRRDCIACAGIIGWTVRQTPLQRRAGLVTLTAVTAAGRKRYHVIDVPAEVAWSVAAAASPWVADSIWAGPATRSRPPEGADVADLRT